MRAQVNVLQIERPAAGQIPLPKQSADGDESKRLGGDTPEVVTPPEKPTDDKKPSADRGPTATAPGTPAPHGQMPPESLKEDEALETADTIEINMSEDVAALFEGEELSEAFKAKATTLFEAAVRTRLKEYEAKLEEIYEAALQDTIAETQQALSEQVEKYLDYVTEEWSQTNAVAIEHQLRTELTESFMNDLRDVYIKHNINVPQDKIEAFEEVATKVNELEDQVNEEISKNLELHEENQLLKKQVKIAAICEGLTLDQKAKIETLAESVKFSDKFDDEIKTLRESYFPTRTKSGEKGIEKDNMINENVDVSDSVVAEISARVAQIINKK